MSILSGPEIKRQVGRGRILIEPYDPRQLNPVSYDVRLGETILEVLPNDTTDMNQILEPNAERAGVIDSKKQQRTARIQLSRQVTTREFEEVFELWPGRLYLGHTAERIRTDHYVPTIDGKSSIGRLGVFIHVTAGYGEPGFDGQWTLEIVVTVPTILYPGMRVGQIRFTAIEGEVERYAGNYTGEYSKGPVPSRAWRQFEQDAYAEEQLGHKFTKRQAAFVIDKPPPGVVSWKPPPFKPLVCKFEYQSWTEWLEFQVREGHLPPGIVKRFRDHPVMNQPFDPPTDVELYEAVCELVNETAGQVVP